MSKHSLRGLWRHACHEMVHTKMGWHEKSSLSKNKSDWKKQTWRWHFDEELRNYTRQIINYNHIWRSQKWPKRNLSNKLTTEVGNSSFPFISGSSRRLCQQTTFSCLKHMGHFVGTSPIVDNPQWINFGKQTGFLLLKDIRGMILKFWSWSDIYVTSNATCLKIVPNAFFVHAPLWQV